jgi:hypothetical protein
MNLRLVFSWAMLSGMAAFSQSVDTPFQMKYAANLNIGDSVFNLSNSGATGGNICAKVYTFSPDEQLISCCSCTITPNALVSLSARADLISNTLTPAVPNSIVVKVASTTDSTCNAATRSSPSIGLLAWGTTLHATPTAGVFAITETPFAPIIPGETEFSRIASLCGFIQANGSGFGICRSCRLGGQGASKQ